jgi:hypothetical protein
MKIAITISKHPDSYMLIDSDNFKELAECFVYSENEEEYSMILQDIETIILNSDRGAILDENNYYSEGNGFINHDNLPNNRPHVELLTPSENGAVSFYYDYTIMYKLGEPESIKEMPTQKAYDILKFFQHIRKSTNCNIIDQITLKAYIKD